MGWNHQLDKAVWIPAMLIHILLFDGSFELRLSTHHQVEVRLVVSI